ncbi:hydrogenase-1 operon protein HyaE [Azoarcus olearius]|uniref:Hydrogenase expression/formation protein n=1 Tax=Azoarcus sp. (strain BH72) TaxID=418699 RepID=A1KC54_AZOSB|nr:hydrogenase-1 operon protein HyaE [Azoarcus olearius]CAL96410.1 Hydrogenase-1 operon protein hyaE [Azoarcus olearius]
MTSPDALENALQRLAQRDGFQRLEASDLPAFAAAPGTAVLLLTDDPVRCPEAWDMVVVLPEALKAVPGLRPAVAAPEASRAIAAGFGITRYPALLVLRGEGAAPGHDYVGALEGMRDWQVLVQSLATLAAAPAGRRPGIGIPVLGAGPSSCH